MFFFREKVVIEKNYNYISFWQNDAVKTFFSQIFALWCLLLTMFAFLKQILPHVYYRKKIYFAKKTYILYLIFNIQYRKQWEKYLTRSYEAWAPLPLDNIKTKEESSQIFTLSKGNRFKVKTWICPFCDLPTSDNLKFRGDPKATKDNTWNTNTKIVSLQRVQDVDTVGSLAVGTFNLKASIFTICGLAFILCIFTPRFGLAHILKSSYL